MVRRIRADVCRIPATFTASSNLPISAGLGSSAAYSTCVASALLIAHKHLSLPSQPSTPVSTTVAAAVDDDDDSGPHFSPRDTDLVDGWAFLAEKVLHGNPSGIDNAVSVRGGAVAFTRSVGGKKGGLEGLHGFSSIRLLLTNTLVPRDTKSLVAGVAAKRLAEPSVVDPILDSIQAISDEAKGLLGGTTHVDRSHLVSRLEVSWLAIQRLSCAGQSEIGCARAYDLLAELDSGQSRSPCHARCLPPESGDDRRCDRC
jgi:hypothetical protein